MEDGRRTTDEGRTTSDKLDADWSAFCPKTKNSSATEGTLRLFRLRSRQVRSGQAENTER